MAEEEKVEEKGSSKLIIIIVAVLALGGGGAFFMMGGDKGGDTKVEEAVKEVEIEKTIEKGITISFKNEDGINSFLMMDVSFVTTSEKSSEYVVSKMSMIKRGINIYLYNLKPEDIWGKGAIVRNEGKFFTIIDKILKDGELGKGHELKHVIITKYIIQE
jgi:flagellar basal body-associated protein FliL